MIKIIFNENNEITIECDEILIKEDIIKIIQEVAKLKTID
jgi:hypothetical protein